MTKPQLWMFALSIVLLMPMAIYERVCDHSNHMDDLLWIISLILMLMGNLTAFIYLFIYLFKIKLNAFTPIIIGTLFSVVTGIFKISLWNWSLIIPFLLNLFN